MVPKFRAWDKENKLMVTNFHRSHMKIETGKVLYQLTTTNENEIKAIASYNTFDDFTYRYSHDLELMQSTGLKDKNGVEIFEGDIVSVRNHPFQKTEKSGAGIEIDGDYAISWNEGDLTWCAGNLLLARLKPYVTVAGNIYENPELLDQPNES